MKLTAKKKYELETLRWFGWDGVATDQEIKDFFGLSERGIKRSTSTMAPFNGFDRLVFAKRDRDLQIAYYREDWGSVVNAWSFLDEPQDYVEWVADKLDRPAILKAWHDNKVNEHRRTSYKLAKEMKGRHNKPMIHRRSEK